MDARLCSYHPTIFSSSLSLCNSQFALPQRSITFTQQPPKDSKELFNYPHKINTTTASRDAHKWPASFAFTSRKRSNHKAKLSETTLELQLKARAHDSFHTKNIKPALAVQPTLHVTQSSDPDSLERYAQLHKRLLFRPHCPLTDRREQWSRHKRSVTECPRAVRAHTPQPHTSPVTTNARQTMGRAISTFHPRLLARLTISVKAREVRAPVGKICSGKPLSCLSIRATAAASETRAGSIGDVRRRRK